MKLRLIHLPWSGEGIRALGEAEVHRLRGQRALSSATRSHPRLLYLAPARGKGHGGRGTS